MLLHQKAQLCPFWNLTKTNHWLRTSIITLCEWNNCLKSSKLKLKVAKRSSNQHWWSLSPPAPCRCPSHSAWSQNRFWRIQTAAAELLFTKRRNTSAWHCGRHFQMTRRKICGSSFLDCTWSTMTLNKNNKRVEAHRQTVSWRRPPGPGGCALGHSLPAHQGQNQL